VTAFIDEHHGRFGVEPICRTLSVSASAYYQRATGERCARAVEDDRVLGVIRELHAANYYAYGYRRMSRHPTTTRLSEAQQSRVFPRLATAPASPGAASQTGERAQPR
jgi:hypothetical protein